MSASRTTPETKAYEARKAKSEAAALELFHKVAERVPAYKDFLKKEKLDPKKVKTYADFQKYVPLIDKQNYVSQYPLADLVFDGDIFQHSLIATSSGSTGTPFFWPRGPIQQQNDTELLAGLYDDLDMNKKKTLLVLCFALGTWIAGVGSVLASIQYAENGNPVSVVTPGIEKAVTLDIIKRLGSSYEQIVIAGYPPFVKDLIEDGLRAGIDWSAVPAKFLFGGEAISEEWRDYLLYLTGGNQPPMSALNLYAAADLGVIGVETPLSVLVQRAYNQNIELRKAQFGHEVAPSIYQYDPKYRHLEKVGSELVVTTNAGIPLVRYNLKDTGSLISPEELTTPLKEEILSEAKAYGAKIDWTKPFVYVNGRIDFVATIYSVNVYPENIKAALLDPRLREFVTGRFTMATGNDDDMDQVLDVNVELAKEREAAAGDHELVHGVIIEKLRELNSEYRKLHDTVQEKALPTISLIQYGDPEYFARGIKHRWKKRKEA